MKGTFLPLISITFISYVATLEPAIIIHGGTYTVSKRHEMKKKEGMLEAIKIGYKILLETGNVLDAVEKAVNRLENLPAFDAGYGSVQTNTGEIEMDAIIINGTDLSAGAVGALRHVANPVSLARKVKDRTPHAFLVGHAAEKFAKSIGVPLVPTLSLIAPSSEYSKNDDYNLGTVGAVAINSDGKIATATSTGGTIAKMNGRIGDSPIIGAGTLADDECCGISTAGVGEAFMRYRVASKIATLIENGRNASEAISSVLEGMGERIPGSEGGAIVITKTGHIGVEWNSKQLAWAYAKNNVIHYGVNKGEHLMQAWSPKTNESCLIYQRK